MAHNTGRESYQKLQQRLNRFPQGAPPSQTLYEILAMLFSEKEAGLVAQLPIKPFTAKTAGRIWRLSEAEAKKILEGLAKRAILLDTETETSTLYTLPPPMAGFFEFALMRLNGRLDQQMLSQLYHQYLQVEEDFIKDLFFAGETRLGRVFVQEDILTNEQAVYVLDYERATHIVTSSKYIAVSMCYCRHKMTHLNKACDAPMDICLTFNNVARSLSKHSYARIIDASEAVELLHIAYENNLVQCGENVQKQVSFICNCCGCCCEALVAAKKFGFLQPLHTTNFLPTIDTLRCNGCGACEKSCPIDAISLVVPSEHAGKKAMVDEQVCLGCGICVRTCNRKSINMKARKERVLTPVNSVHRIVMMAIERGKLQELIFDNKALFSHRAMAAVLSAILKMPPLKQAMASRQFKSVYLEQLIKRKLDSSSS